MKSIVDLGQCCYEIINIPPQLQINICDFLNDHKQKLEVSIRTYCSSSYPIVMNRSVRNVWLVAGKNNIKFTFR